MTTDSIEAPDYESFVDTRVRLVYIPEPDASTPENTDPDAEEIIAQVVVYNSAQQVLMVRPRRKTIGFLIETFRIIEIEPDLEPPKVIKQKVLKAVDLTTVRQHLADRHGYTLPQVNALTDEAGEEEHNAIDHKDLGHSHEEGDPEDSDENDSDTTGGVEE